MRGPAPVLALAALCGMGAAQQTGFVDEVPKDAREFLAWHRKVSAAEPEPNGLSWQAYNYLRAGALEEAGRVVADLVEADPGNPDAERYRVELQASDPALRAEAAAAARRWLGAHSAMPAGFRDSVRQTLGRMERELARREQVGRSQFRSRLLPPFAVLGVLVLAGWLSVQTRRR